MDPVSAGSAVLAFITTAISSARVIHDFVSSFRDSPQNLKQTANSVKSLRAILDLLSNSRALKGVPDVCPAGLLESIKRCNEDLAAFAQKVCRLQPSETERRAGLWKRVKTAFSEKELHHLQSVVGYHSQTLNTWLTALQCDVILESREQLEQVGQAVQSLDQSFSRHVNFTETQSAVLQGQSLAFDSLSNKLDHVHHGFNAVASNISSRILAEMASNHAESMAATSSQMDMMLGLLKETLELKTSFKHQVGVAGEVKGNMGEGNTSTVVGSSHDDEMLRDEHLNERISRLCSRFDAKEGILRSDKAADIIDDLRYLLDATRTQVRKLKAKEMASSSSIDRDATSDPLPGDLKRFSATFAAAQRISINQAERAHPYPPGTLIRQNRNRKEIELSAGTLVITTNKRRQGGARADSQHDHESDSDDDPEDFTAKLVFLPKDLKSHKMIEATVHIQELLSGSSWSIPRFSVNNVLPYESRVFDVVQSGNVKEFRLMLGRGEASFRDHDPSGASLLMYALRMAKVEMCHYLIDNGADTSHVGVVSSPWTGVSNIVYVTPRSAETDVGLQCLKLLLKAGADPTFDNSLFEQAFVANTQVAEICLSLGDPFLTVHTTDESGRTPLLAACNNFFLRLPMMDLLVRRGSDLHARDSHGRTCLHLAMLHVTYPEDHPRDYDAVMFLVRNGADVRAADHQGLTVSDVAYAWCRMDTVQRLGSYRGDLWDSVLAACGYDVAEFRKGWPRVTSWTARYTKQYFDASWAGMGKNSCFGDEAVVLNDDVIEVDGEPDLDEPDVEDGGVAL